jgi:hypothetical protein
MAKVVRFQEIGAPEMLRVANVEIPTSDRRNPGDVPRPLLAKHPLTLPEAELKLRRN